jgi:riboflavin biosynthesis pyrimidine reductase
MPRKSAKSSRILRAELSLDGKLFSTGMSTANDRFAALENADELHLSIQPVILGGVKNPTLTRLPEGFLPQDLNFKLLSAATVSGKLLLRYRRIARVKKRV